MRQTFFTNPIFRPNMNKASYEDKLDPRLFGIFQWVLEMFDSLGINKGGDFVLIPELYEKYVT